MTLTRFPHGVSSFGIPVIGSGALTTTGNVWFVHNSTGSDGNEGIAPDAPFKTLDYAVGKCTASQGDIIVMMPGSNESITSTIAVDVAGVSIIGLGHGQATPMLTQATTGSDNVMEITAANVLIENVYFKGSTTGTSETFIDLSGAADNCTIRGCVFEQNTKNLNAVVVAVGADYLTVEGCKFIGVGAGADYGVFFKNATSGTTKAPVIRDCLFHYTGSTGCDLACIGVSMSSGTMTGLLVKDCQFIGLADGEKAVNPKMTAGTTITGLCNNLSVLTADATDAFIVTNVLGYINCFATEAGKRPAGAVSGSGGSAPPVATSAL